MSPDPDPRDTLAPFAPLAPGTRLGVYEVTMLLGAGGMGRVYKARDTRLDRAVALKVLSETLVRDSRARTFIEREAKAISRLNHPHICTLYDIGHHEGIDYLVMEFLAGQTVREQLDHGPFTPDMAIRCGRQIAEAYGRGASMRSPARRPEAEQRDGDGEWRESARLRSVPAARLRPDRRCVVDRDPGAVASERPGRFRTCHPSSSKGIQVTRGPTSSRLGRCCTKW
jgi:hypothetical protein